MLSSDNGGVYPSREFDTFCREVDIKNELKVPYQTHQNMVVKRKNRPIIDTSKAMIHDIELPIFLWA